MILGFLVCLIPARLIGVPGVGRLEPKYELGEEHVAECPLAQM